MAYEHQKSWTTILLDLARHLLVLALTGYLLVHIWHWQWMVAIIAALPVYLICLNLVGFATLPFYALTPENRLGFRAMRAMEHGNLEEASRLTLQFVDRFHVDMPEGAEESIRNMGATDAEVEAEP
jgi:hypothetical protein